MPQNNPVAEDDIDRIEAGTSVNQEYKKQVLKILNHYKSFPKDVEKEERPVEDVVAESHVLFKSLVKKFFFMDLTVTEVEVDHKTC